MFRVVAKSGSRREGHPTRSTRERFRSPFHSISNPVYNLLDLTVYKGGSVHEGITVLFNFDYISGRGGRRGRGPDGTNTCKLLHL